MIIAAILLLTAQAGAAEASDPEWNCADPVAQQEMNFCAAQDFKRADAELNAQWPLTVTHMQGLDREVDREYDQQPGYVETLRAAQRAWIVLRDETCRLQSFEARGGSMQPMLDSGCKAHLTELRTLELRDLVVGPEGE